MSDVVIDRVEEAQKKIQELLEQYARHRDSNNYVGQFLDEEGCKSNQKGIYGISIWSCLTNNINDDQVIDLRTKCRTYLKELVARVKAADPVTLKSDSEEYEVRYITSKICYLFEALNQINDAADEALYLKELIRNAQQSDGSWGFSVDSKDGDPIVTSLVLRAFQHESNLLENLNKASTYLRSRVKQTDKLNEKLFILNSLQRTYELNIQVESEIKSTIKKIYKRAYNPAAPNLINIDYTDPSGRTRYFRLPTDMIFLESLTLISGSNLEYLRIHTGKQIIDNLLKTLNRSSKFTLDPSEHRASVGVYSFTSNVLTLIIRRRNSPKLPFLWMRDLYAWISYSLSFGADLTWNLIVLISSLVLFIVFTCARMYGLAGSFLGISIKTMFDIIKSIYNFYSSRGES